MGKNCSCHSHSHNHDEPNARCAGGSGDMHHHGESHMGFLHTYMSEIISGLLLIAGIVLEHTGVFDLISGSYHHLFNIQGLIFYLIAIVPVGWPVIREMFGAWRHGSVMNEFTLMVGASVGAFIIGEYPEAVAVLLFYSFGEKMEDTASDDVKKRIKALLGRLPDTAVRKDADKLTVVNPRDLRPGDIIIVKPGERVAVDAVLTGTEDVDFDTSAITGESVPRTYHPGEEISSGMIPADRAVELKTVRLFSDSSMSRIMKMIEDAQASKSPTENLLRRITRWYTPAVFILAALVFFVPWIASMASGNGFEWMKWLRRSLVFLVCSCPCALVVSIPLSYFASLGNAARKGLLFKGSKYVDSMRDIDTVVFDKTGTLTSGVFHISSILPADGHSSEEVLCLAASLDAESAHPLAKAIVEAARAKGFELSAVRDVKTVPHGMEGWLVGKRVLVGSRSLMNANHIAAAVAPGEGSEICVAAGNKYIGSIFLLDTVKPEAARAVEALHRLGIGRIVILSGDRAEEVKRIAEAVGADEWQAALLPARKQAYIDRLRSEGRRVSFVGDGINDAPAIASADVGVAMGTLGTDIAMESSDVVIATDNLSQLPLAVRLARKVRRVVIENVTFAMGIKVLVMTLGAFGVATLWAAVFADTGVTLITIMWTLLRLRK